MQGNTLFARAGLALALNIATVCLPLSFAAALAGEAVQAGDLKLETPWTRATPPNAMVGGGYLTITNTGSEPDRLIAAASPIAAKVEIHDMKVENGIMTMRPVSGGLVIPAGETVTLAPGGLHVMFVKLTGPMKQGERVAATLTFEKAGAVEIMFPVAAIGASKPDHAGHAMGN